MYEKRGYGLYIIGMCLILLTLHAYEGEKGEDVEVEREREREREATERWNRPRRLAIPRGSLEAATDGAAHHQSLPSVPVSVG